MSRICDARAHKCDKHRVTLAELPRAMQIQLAAIGPLVFEVVCGRTRTLHRRISGRINAERTRWLAGGVEHAHTLAGRLCRAN
jgi:hypothetical protein